jgi:hypothetical protein
MSSNQSESESGQRAAAQFATTHWSVVLAAGDSTSPDCRQALEKLCRTGWYPLYAFVRRKGYSPEDTNDLTGAFFERFREKYHRRDVLAAWGRFRTFLVMSLQRFLCDQFDRSTMARGARVNTLNPMRAVSSLWLRILPLALIAVALRTASAEPTAVRQHIAFPDARLEVCGLPWFGEDKLALRRLPLRLKRQFRAPVWDLAQDPSGGRIRFRTDSTTVGVVAENPHFSNMHHMASVGENGFDLYVGRDYAGSAWPDASGKIAKEWRVGRERQMRDITLYLPLYKPVTIQELSLDSDAQLESARPYAVAKPIVYYGSSITQGGCASNPGGSCQAILERKLNADFVNLGFSGNGLGEPALAEAICELDPSCIVLDFWGNPSAEQYADALPAFVDILRRKWPRLPILVTSPFYFPAEAIGGDVAREQSAKRVTARELVEKRRQGGDRRIWHVDGLKMLSREQATGLVDGVHCNSLGFYYNARGLEPFLRKALK